MRQNENLLFIPLMLFSAFLISSPVSADDSVTDDVNIIVPVSCSLEGTGMTSHNANIVNGTYQGDIGSTTLKAFCNDADGFAIYAIGYTDNEYGKTVLTNSTLGSTHDIATGTATSGSTSNWAMKLATVTNPTPTYPITLDNSFNAYHSVPSSYTKVAHRDSETDIGTNATGASLTSTYAAFMSQTQPAGTYTGQVKYTLVHPSDRAAPVACNDKATTISQAVCLQDFAHVTETNRSSIIASMTPEQQYTLKDSRDGKTYTIAKYQVDNNGNYDVWMTQNLDLDLVAGETYTNMDTDIGYDDATNTYNTASWSPIRSTYSATSTHTHAWCEGGTWNSQYNHCELNNTPESYDPGDLYWNATESNWNNDWSAYNISCTFNTNTPVCDQTQNPISNFISTTSSTPQYRLGNYYNWAAALATNDSSVYNSGYPPEQSICPAGWALLKNRSGNGTFYKLWNQYGFTNTSINGSNKLWTNPLYFVLGGAFEDGYLRDLGSDGAFWSSTPDGSLRASGAFFGTSGYAYSSGAADRYNGLSVRCLVRQVYNSGSGGEVWQ